MAKKFKFREGLKVKRSGSFTWGTQDFLNGKPGAGTITRHLPHSNNFDYQVQWENGSSYNYRESDLLLLAHPSTFKEFTDFL